MLRRNALGALPLLLVLSLASFPGYLHSLASAPMAARAASPDHPKALPKWLPFHIPLSLYEKWRKYGPWDYKEQGFKYRAFTLFNFGAAGGAAGLNQAELQALARASRPTPKDLRNLGKLDLEANFNRNASAFKTLREMVQHDARLIRIANDFTWLDNSTKWPRKDIGVSPARWKDYRLLFQKLSLSEGIVRTQDFPGAIFMIARARGLCTGGSSAGYVYSTEALTPTTKSPVKTLDADARRNPDKHYSYVFKPIKADWYAFYEVDW